MRRILLAGLNHRTAPLAVREKLAFSGQQRNLALSAFKGRFPEAEAVLLSTCNRVELYVARETHGHPRAEEIVEFLAGFHGLSAIETAPHLYQKTDRDAAAHLFAVASSLDSMVLGETQILGQVREAYELATSLNSAGASLNPLFQSAVAVGKKVMSQTQLADGRLSVASVAVDYAKRIFDDFSDKAILAVGAGKMANLALKALAGLKPGRLLVCNRDSLKAAALADEFSGKAFEFSELGRRLEEADIVIASTAAPSHIISREMIEHALKKRRYRPMFLLDLSIPRNVEPTVGDLEHVYLCNLDDLQQVTADTLQKRAGAVESAGQIVEKEVAAFMEEQEARQMGPKIEEMYKKGHELAAEELARTLNKIKGVDAEDLKQLEEMTRRIVNKLLHEPICRMKEGK